MEFEIGREDCVLRLWFGAMVLMLAPLAFGARAEAAESPPRTLALALAPVGNAWRAALLGSWERTAAGAIRDGRVAEAPMHLAKANTIAAEAAQLTALIATHPSAIVIDAGSPQALNPIVRQACDAGIVVVSFDGIVTEPCAYRVQYDFHKLGAMELDYVATRLPSGGRLLEMRGASSTDLDDTIHDGIAAAVAAKPRFQTVAQVHGNWRRGDAKRNVGSVISVLPAIDAVLTQGGEALGVADAFIGSDRPMPIIILGNRADELAWWKAQRDADGYQTLSIAPSPGIASLAFRIAQMVLDGTDVPHDVTAPFLTVESGDLDQALETAQDGGFYSRDYTRADAEQAVAATRP
jgi:ribose transport system substrate-binding protein